MHGAWFTSDLKIANYRTIEKFSFFSFSATKLYLFFYYFAIYHTEGKRNAVCRGNIGIWIRSGNCYTMSYVMWAKLYLALRAATYKFVGHFVAHQHTGSGRHRPKCGRPRRIVGTPNCTSWCHMGSIVGAYSSVQTLSASVLQSIPRGSCCCERGLFFGAFTHSSYRLPVWWWIDCLRKTRNHISGKQNEYDACMTDLIN